MTHAQADTRIVGESFKRRQHLIEFATAAAKVWKILLRISYGVAEYVVK